MKDRKELVVVYGYYDNELDSESYIRTILKQPQGKDVCSLEKEYDRFWTDEVAFTEWLKAEHGYEELGFVVI